MRPATRSIAAWRKAPAWSWWGASCSNVSQQDLLNCLYHVPQAGQDYQHLNAQLKAKDDQIRMTGEQN